MADETAPAIVVGGGPAGLMAAEVLSAAGVPTVIVDRMPTLGRKLLMAGRGGLNLTHSEPLARQLERYGTARERLAPVLEHLPPAQVVAWCEGLGQATFIGSSGRVFPKAMKASPLLRAWLARLEAQGVRVETRLRWTGFAGPSQLDFVSEGGGEARRLRARGVVLALGGASWPRLGSDGNWVGILGGDGIAVTPLAATNCGIVAAWSDFFRTRFAGTPLKRIAVTLEPGFVERVRGELTITLRGLEGSPVYALGPAIRATLRKEGRARLTIDLRPDLDLAAIERRLAAPRRKQSLSTFLRKALGLTPQAIALLREAADPAPPGEGAAGLARRIKAVPIDVVAVAGLERAISTAGGIAWEELDDRLMLKRRPGVFAAGEMIDWEAPTGGYLLGACLASGSFAARGLIDWLSTSGRRN